MLRFAHKYSQKFNFAVDLSLADVSSLPYPDETFDWAISVATYHHIRDRKGQKAAFSELRRILKPGGEAFITVWNRWQPRFWLKRKNIQVPWRTGEDTLYRYYHLFSYGEIEKLVKKAGFEVVASSPESRYHFPLKMFSKNICLLVKKAAAG